jgi:LuxR family maltose regulon positive regulatory protein
VLLGEWTRRGRLPVAWLSLDAADNDPVRFWRHAVAALDLARPGLGERLAPLVGPPAPPSREALEGLVTALINDLAAQRGPDAVVFVLDDYHVIDSAQVHASLHFLLEHRPPVLRVVLAGRSDPPLALARLRARGQLDELRAADLRFTADEAAGLLQHVAQLPATALTDETVAALSARTEGWLPDDAIRHATAAGAPGWAARIIEEHFDAVYYLHSEGATIQRWLAALPADVVRSRPRLLLARALLAATGGRVEAVEPLLEAAERTAAAADDEPLFEPTVGAGASMLVNVPALICLHSGYLAQLRGDADGTVAFAAQALARSRPGEWLLRSNIEGFQAVAAWLRGRLTEAESALASGIVRWQEAGQLTMTGWGGFQLAQIQRAQGRLDAAARTCRQMLATTAPPGRPPVPAAGPALIGLGEVAYQRNELDAALRYVTEGIELCRRLDYTTPLAFGLATLAWIRQVTGDPPGALDTIVEAERAVPGPVGLLNPVPAQRARLYLAQDDVAGAGGWTAEHDLSADDEPDYPREPGHLVLARVLIAEGRADRALCLLDRLHALAVTQKRTGSVIELRALQALSLAALGREAAALGALASAVTLAHPRSYVRVFADEGPTMAALLGRLMPARRADPTTFQIPLGYLARLQRAFQPEPTRLGPGRGRPSTSPVLLAALTGRELQVLRLLADGRSNLAIAEELVVTLDTVKKHVSHVLDKLGGTNRTEAAARARALGLLP